jgi:mono/diheme cytochrome c family protein
MLPAMLVGIAVGIGAAGCGLFQSEQIAKGQKLYAHYCMHCHGKNGRQKEGYNWAQMSDPRPKDLSNKDEMSTLKDQEIFETISRDMKDTTPELGDKIGDDEFAVPTMPTFKHTLSEEEIWDIVAYVRTLHGTKLSFDIEGRKKELEANLQAAQQSFDAAEKKASEEADRKSTKVDESAYAKEKEALVAAKKDLDKAKAALTNFSARPKFAAIPRPELTLTSDQTAKLAETGKRLYLNKYGCNACHRVGDAGGVVGPGLDRAGFRLNSTWVYRWIKYPQSMKPDTRMPNLGLSDSDAKAVTMYLSTLKALPPEQPATQAAR